MSSRVTVHSWSGPGFVRVPNDFARSKLDPNVTKVLLYLASHTGTKVLYDGTAAEAVGMSRNRFARSVEAAAKTNHLVRVLVGQDRHGNAEYALHVSLLGFKADEKASILLGTCVNLKHVRAPDWSTREEVSSSLEEARISVSARNGKAPFPAALPDDWKPNHTHAVMCERLDLDLSEMVEEFLRSQAASEQRSDWDKTFAAFVNGFTNGDYWETAHE